MWENTGRAHEEAQLKREKTKTQKAGESSCLLTRANSRALSSRVLSGSAHVRCLNHIHKPIADAKQAVTGTLHKLSTGLFNSAADAPIAQHTLEFFDTVSSAPRTFAMPAYLLADIRPDSRGIEYTKWQKKWA